MFPQGVFPQTVYPATIFPKGLPFRGVNPALPGSPGPNSGSVSAYATSASGTGWTNANNAVGSPNGTFATVALGAGATSNGLALVFPVPPLPAGASITSVKFTITHKTLSGVGYASDFTVETVRQILDQTPSAAAWPTVLGTRDYGGGLMGAIWAPNDFSTFIFTLFVSTVGVGGDTFSVDSVQATINYADATSNFKRPSQGRPSMGRPSNSRPTR